MDSIWLVSLHSDEVFYIVCAVQSRERGEVMIAGWKTRWEAIQETVTDDDVTGDNAEDAIREIRAEVSSMNDRDDDSTGQSEGISCEFEYIDWTDPFPKMFLQEVRCYSQPERQPEPKKHLTIEAD